MSARRPLRCSNGEHTSKTAAPQQEERVELDQLKRDGAHDVLFADKPLYPLRAECCLAQYAGVIPSAAAFRGYRRHDI